MVLIAKKRTALKHTNPQAAPRQGQLVNIINKATSYSCLAGESGSHYMNVGASGGVVFTLPALLAGWEAWFHSCIIDQDLSISSPDADTMVVFNDIAADQIAWNQANERAGGTFHVTCDGVLWYVSEMGHDAQTAAIATA